ncbi:MAG: UDP-N-acetylglucosamine 2-epimerase [Candidatus Omnitrophota bacterium]
MQNKYFPFENWKHKILQFLSSDSQKTVFFIKMQENLDKLALLIEEIEQEFKGKFIIICFNSKVPVYFQGLNFNLGLSEDYLQGQDYKYIDEYALNLTRTWYLVRGEDGKNITEYENIHLGCLTEFNFQWFLICRLKYLEVINRVVSLEKPDKIITIEDTEELCDAAKITGQINNIPILSLVNRPIFHSLIFLKRRVRDRFSDIFYFFLIDPLVQLFLMRAKLNNFILIDPRAYLLLTGHHRLENFIFCPIGKGLANRIYSLKRKKTYISFNIPASGRMKRRLKEQVNKFFVKWEELSRNSSFKDRFIYKDIPIWGLVEGALSQFFKERFPRILNIIAQLKQFSKDRSIKSIVLRADGREIEKTIIMAARELNIPTLYITHGVLSENNGHDILFCTKTAVWGQADFDRYISLGNPTNKLAITGSPKYDRIYSKSQESERKIIYKKLGLDPKKKFIILATQPITKFSSYRTEDENEVLLRSVIASIKKIPNNIKLVVKLHPFEDYSIYERLIKKIGSENFILVRDIDIFALIRASILLMTVNSTVGLEAMILDKPLITINLTKRKDALPFAERGAALGVYKAEDIAPAIEGLLENAKLKEELVSNRKKLVAYYAGKLDGCSSQRIVELINTMSATNFVK